MTTIDRWGVLAQDHVKMTDTHVILYVGDEAIPIGPIENVTRRKATWADCHWFVAKIMERAANTSPPGDEVARLTRDLQRAEGLHRDQDVRIAQLEQENEALRQQLSRFKDG